MLRHRPGRPLQQRAQILEGGRHGRCTSPPPLAVPVALLRVLRVGAQPVHGAVERVEPRPEVVPARPAGKGGQAPAGEPPAAAIDEAAGQHGDDVAQAPAVPGQVHQAPQPGPEGAGAQRLSGGRVEGQVVLGEHLPGHAQVGRRLAECDGEVGGPEGRLIGQALLDLARHGPQLGFPVGRGACHHGRGRSTIPFELRDFRIREPMAQPLAVVGGTVSCPGVQRDDDLGLPGEGFDEVHLRRSKEMEAIEQDRAGQSRTRPDGVRRGRAELHRVSPASLSQVVAVLPVDGSECLQASRSGSLGGVRQGPGIHAFRQQITDGAAEEASQPPGLGHRLEVGGGPALDGAADGPPQEFLGQRVGRHHRVGGQRPAELADRLDTQAQDHPASADETAAKLVSMAHRRHQHDRFGERVGLVSGRQPRDDPVRLAAAGTADEKGWFRHEPGV